MNRLGNRALGIAAIIILAFVVNTIVRWYMDATPLQIFDVEQALWRAAKIGGISSLVFCIALLASLFFTARRATKLDKKTRSEIHNATEE